MSTNPVKRALIEIAEDFGSDWIGKQAVWLGDLEGVVETGVPGEYYARQANGQVITVVNMAKVAPIFDLHVLVRRSRIQPGVWQITEIIEDYNTPAAQGLITNHHEQHEEEGSDRVNIDRKQIIQLTCRVSSTWAVTIYGATVPTQTGIALIDNQIVDLSSYVIGAGAKYVSIEVDDSGTLSVHDGSLFGAPELGAVSDIPIPDPGKYMLAYILFYAGQGELTDANIRVPMPLPIIPKPSGLQVSEADPDTPASGDLFGFWDIVDETLKSITWAGIVAALTAIFDLLYLGDAPSDGSLYGRKDSAWEVIELDPVSGSGTAPDHGLARWAGAASETVFELPDLASALLSVKINGLEEDPIVYSLSSNGSQIILDTGLASASTVTALYIIKSA
jgi:hypothetical protein